MPSSRGLMGITTLFGFRGLSASTVQIVDTDSGVGVDAAEVVAEAIADTDAGVGVDGTEVINTIIPDAETGVGVDVLTLISVVVPDTDSGAGADDEVPSGGYTVQAPDVEAGVGVETESIAVTLNDTDAGTGVDSEVLATDRDLEVCITSIEGDLVIEMDITSEECD